MKIHDFAAQGDHDGLRHELQNGIAVDARDKRNYTPLACAASSPHAGEEVLRLLIVAGADVNALVDEENHFPLDLAACSGSLDKVRLLLASGAKVNLASPKGYTALIYVLYALHDADHLVPVVDLLVKHGANIDCITDYGEFALGAASCFGRFDVVHYLLEAGADLSPLKWTPLMRAVAVGSCEDVQRILTDSADLVAKDRFERTPLLLAAAVGDIEKLDLICARRANLDERDRMGDTAHMIAGGKGNIEVLHRLINHGADIDAVNKFGKTALMFAAESGSAECVQLLLKAGANQRFTNSSDECAMGVAASEAVVRLLVEAGEDIGDLSTEMKRTLLGLNEEHVWTISKSEYALGSCPQFGTSNPDLMQVPFWHEMVKAGVSAYSAKTQFGEADIMIGPVWCFSRFGMSFTELPDGRFVQIGGEHEDFYDPDFCIYNDVVIHERSGKFTIMGYPKEVFPPTDFHSATYVDGFIYIVGRLGYHGERTFGTTPVYRLDCQTWRMERLPSSGDNPGWLFKHKASLEASKCLIISGGTICIEVGGEEQHVENEVRFRLDLRNMTWTKSPK